MALAWRFIVESELRAGGICVWSTARGGDSRSRRGPKTCWGNSPIGGQAKTDPRTITMNWRSHMTLIKSILLGSAAGIVAVATAQAADLPTRKAAPVEYVRVCNVGGITGWTLPGSDTCVKLSGYITAQFEGGNLNTQYNYGSIGDALTAAGYVGPAECWCLAGLTAVSGLNSRNHSAGPSCRQPRSKQPDLQSQPGWLDVPRQLRVRFCLEHRLRPLDRAFRHQC